MLDVAVLASRTLVSFTAKSQLSQDVSVIEEEIISILNHVLFNICLYTTSPIYLTVGHAVEFHPGNVDWILSITCIF